MNIPDLVYYMVGGSIGLVVLVIVINLLVNVLIKQSTERALQHFRQRLSQEVVKSLSAFREGVCEQMAMQERKSDSLAKLYSSLIDLLRDGKEFSASLSTGGVLQTEKTLSTFGETSRSFSEQFQRQSLHFSNDFKVIIDGFIAEQEAVTQFFEMHWNSGRKNAPEKSVHIDQMRQTWVKAEDRIVAVMNLMRDEFRKRVQPPESIMKKWLNDAPSPKTSPVAKPAR